MVHTTEGKQVRNRMFFPDLQNEGVYLKTLPEPSDWQSKHIWYDDLEPYERMFYHQTLNSARRYSNFIQSPLVPKDSLDFSLASRYNHSLELFPEKNDGFLQKESINEETFRRIRNTNDRQAVKSDRLGHPLRIGGTTDKISPHSVKLINSGHHTQMTNPGYSRQPADGNFFNY